MQLALREDIFSDGGSRQDSLARRLMLRDEYGAVSDPKRLSSDHPSDPKRPPSVTLDARFAHEEELRWCAVRTQSEASAALQALGMHACAQRLAPHAASLTARHAKGEELSLIHI